MKRSCQAKVRQPHGAMQIQQQIRRLHVSVDDSAMMRVIQCIRDLFTDPGDGCSSMKRTTLGKGLIDVTDGIFIYNVLTSG